MSASKIFRTVTLGAVLAAPLAFAAAPSLDCPAGTVQTGSAKDGLFCRKGASGAAHAHGPYAAFHTNGQKAAAGQYENGFRTGTWTFYDAEGRVTGTTEFARGDYNGKRVEFHANGQTKRVEHFAQGKREGLVQEFNAKGELMSQGRYANDALVADK